MTDILFYFDFASPYGYLASHEIDPLAARYGRTVAWKPILLGAIFKRTGMRPNLHQPLRSAYFRHDCARFARLRGIPFQMPGVMPMNAVAASRLYYWLADANPQQARTFAQTVFHRHFVEGSDLGGPPEVVAAAASIGVDPIRAEAALQEPAVKARLRHETETAEALGVFGSPYIIVDGEPFWGADRLDQVERWLATGGW